jgi:hypothetical protein
MGCANPFIRVTSTLRVVGRPGDAAEVRTSTWITQPHAPTRSIAVEAPDECFNREASEVTGTATVQDHILHLRCAVEMSEVERGLTAAGYAVHSWRTLRDLRSSRELSAIQAARELGAQLILHINSFATVTWARAPVDIRWDREIFESSPAGVRGRPLPANDFSSESLSRFESIVQAAESETARSTRVGVELDATAVLAHNGRAVWFYRRVAAAPLSNGESVNVLLTRVGGEWTAVLPPPETTAEAAAFQSTRAISLAAGSDDTRRASSFAVLRELVTDMANHLRIQLEASIDPTQTISPPVPVPSASASPPPAPAAPPSAAVAAPSAAPGSVPTVIPAAPFSEVRQPAAPVLVDPEQDRDRRHRRRRDR